jgi:hypothetical protein
MCVQQKTVEALEYLNKGNTISRPNWPNHLEQMTLKSGKKIILCVNNEEEDEVCFWEPTQDDFLATDWVVI